MTNEQKKACEEKYIKENTYSDVQGMVGAGYLDESICNIWIYVNLIIFIYILIL